MVDFKKILQDMYDNATPEERERMDARRKKEAEYKETEREIEASFSVIGERYTSPAAPGISMRSGGKPSEKKYEQFVRNTYKENIIMRMEGDIIRFSGGSTGHESYRVDQEFVDIMKEWVSKNDGSLAICCGSPTYKRCEVNTKEVLDYIKEQRPQFFEENTMKI